MTRFPWPHWISKCPIEPIVLDACRQEFGLIPDEAWQRFDNALERKLAITFEGACQVGHVPATRLVWDLLKKPQVIDWIGAITGISGLQFDGLGGGLHKIEPGGYLAVHRDFNRDGQGRWRRVNLLIYLNRDWQDDEGGHLDLYDSQGVRFAHVAPEFGQMVVFECGRTSWHGHPEPCTRERRSIAAYYFTDDPPPDPEEPHSTIFMEV